MGQPVDIPIILRTLAGSIALCDEESLPLTSTPDYLAMLDAGEFEKVVVNNFELSWWTSRKPRDLNAVEILNASTVERCLDHYTTQRESQHESSIPNPGPGTGLTREALRFHDAGTAAVAGPSTGSKPPPTGAGERCSSCPRYRQLLSDVLGDILKYQNFASVMATSSKNLFQII